MKDLGTNTLETERLILRRYTLDDVDGMYYGWATDENTTKYVSWNVHPDKEFTKELITKRIAAYEEGAYDWVVEVKDSHELIGNIRVGHMSKKNHNAEIGYCYGSKYWNKGYATEALKAVIDYLLDECELHVVEAKHYSTNPASGKVMRKAGMIQEAVLVERRYEENTDTYSDLICYYIKR